MTRHVIPTREVYHLWAQGNTNTGANGAPIHARNAGNTASFNGSQAFSYAACIGRIVRNKKGQRAYLVTLQSWSITTTRHQSYLRSAIPNGYKIFYVPALERDRDSATEHKTRKASYLSRIGGAALSAKNARTERMRDVHTVKFANLTQELADYCAFFGIRAPSVNVEILTADVERARANEKRREQAEAAARKRALEERAARWLADEDGLTTLPYDYPDTLLRVARFEFCYDVGRHEVETSRGASVPYDAARRIYHAWRANTQQRGDRVGAFAVSDYDADGRTLTIGCHVITRAEAERFAASEGWNDPAEAERFAVARCAGCGHTTALCICVATNPMDVLHDWRAGHEAEV